LSRLDFVEKFMQPALPVIVTDVYQMLPQLRTVNLSWLSTQLGSKAVRIACDGKYSDMSFKVFYANFQEYTKIKNPQDVPYLSDWRYWNYIPSILNMFSPIPSILEDWPNYQLPTSKFPYTFGFVGPARAQSPLHSDDHSTHGWLIQLEGKKECKLWAPNMFPWKK